MTAGTCRVTKSDSLSRADHAQRFTGDFTAAELLLFLLQFPGHDFRVLDVGHLLDTVHAVENTPGPQQQAGRDDFLDRVGVRTGRVEDDDAAMGVVGDRYIVDAGPGTGHRDHAVRHRLVMQFVAAQDESLRFGDLRTDLVSVEGKAAQSDA